MWVRIIKVKPDPSRLKLERIIRKRQKNTELPPWTLVLT